MTAPWIGWTLQAALLLLLGLGLSLALRRQSAATRRMLWLGVFVGALVVCASPVVPDSLRLRVPLPARVTASTALQDFVPGTLALPASEGAVRPGGARRQATGVAERAAPRLSLLVVCWGIGALVLLLRQGVALLLTRRLLRRASGLELELFDELCRLMGIRRRVALRQSGAIAAPVTAGIWRPVVVLPHTWRTWPAARLTMALCHELAHVRRHDCLAQLLANVVAALQWHDPLVWLAARCFRRERELAADDAVLLVGTRPSAYARSLVELAGTRPPRTLGATVSMAEPSFFSRRVESILAQGRRRAGSRVALLCAGTIVAGLTLGTSCVKTGSPPAAAVEAAGLALPSAERIERRIHHALPEGSRAAVVVGLLLGAQQRIVGVGQVREGSRERPDGDTLFGVGSITELFTGLAFADLLASGELTAEIPVNQLLPPEARIPTTGRAITLLDLATHRSGLPPLPTNFIEQDPARSEHAYQPPLLHAFLAGHRPEKVGSFRYSYLGVGLLGRALAHHARTDYRQLVADRVFDPLGLTGTDFFGRDGRLRARLAEGRDARGKKLGPRSDFPTLGACCAIRTTANDLLRLIALQVHPAGPLARAARLMRVPHTATGIATGEQIGIGWHILGNGLLIKRGGGRGFKSMALADPQRRLGVVVLAASEGLDAETLAMEMLREAQLAGRGPRRGERSSGEEQLPPALHRSDATFGDRIRLLGWTVDSSRVKAGGSVVVTFFYRALRPLARDWKVFVHAEGPDKKRILADHYPQHGASSTERWRVGQIVRDAFHLRVPRDHTGPLTLHTGWYGASGRLPVTAGPHDGKDRVPGPTVEVLAAR